MTRDLIKPIARALLLPIAIALIAPQLAFAQRRSRGSVSSATRQGQRASGNTTRTRTGDSATRTTTGRTRSGETVTGSKNVTKDGDTVTVNRNAQSTSGASGSSKKEYEIDDGRVESVERSAQATDRYGRSANYEGKAERDGSGVKFEGEGTNRYGQDVDVEGYGARGRGVVAEVEGGRYGDRYVAAGRYPGGRPWATTLPAGYHPYNYHGRPYYGYGGYYYRPMGGMYVVVPPPYGAYYSTVPVGAIALTVAGVALMYSAGTYYQKTSKEGSVSYEVVPAPAGASITTLPVGSATVSAGGSTYYYCANTFYTQAGGQGFTVVAKPSGITAIGALPADFKPVEAGGVTYFVAGGQHYLSYLDPTGQELYIVVNAPAAEAAGPVTTKAIPISLAAGTPIKIRLATTLDSGKAKAGQIFEASIEHDLVSSGQIVAPKGSRVQGRVTEAHAAGSKTAPLLALQLTGVSSGGRIVPISSPVVKAEGKASHAGGKALGGAAIGATIGAIADGGEGAAIGGVVGGVAGGVAGAASKKQVTLAAGTTLDFTTAEAATFYKTVTVQAGAPGN